jgi:hypothetical protein
MSRDIQEQCINEENFEIRSFNFISARINNAFCIKISIVDFTMFQV